MIESYPGVKPSPAILRLLRPRPWLQAFVELVSLASRQRSLTIAMARREIATEHAGKALGMFWGIFQPLFLLAVYAFVYGVVFRAKIGGTYELPRNFTIYLLSGLVPWFAFQLCMSKAATVIPANAASRQAGRLRPQRPADRDRARVLLLARPRPRVHRRLHARRLRTRAADVSASAASSSCSQFLAMAGVAFALVGARSVRARRARPRAARRRSS